MKVIMVFSGNEGNWW